MPRAQDLLQQQQAQREQSHNASNAKLHNIHAIDGFRDDGVHQQQHLMLVDSEGASFAGGHLHQHWLVMVKIWRLCLAQVRALVSDRL